MRSLPCDAAIEAADATTRGMWFWGLLFLAVVAYELWAWRTGHLTLTQTTRRGPRWFRWALGSGLVVLIWHLFAPPL